MRMRTLSAAVPSAAGAALIAGTLIGGALFGGALFGGAVGLAPAGQAAPGGDGTPPCLAEGTCALLTPKTQVSYLPLTPASVPRSAPLAPEPH